jgi:hypothetical protein
MKSKRRIIGLMSPSSGQESRSNTSACSESLIKGHKVDYMAVAKRKGPGAIIKKKTLVNANAFAVVDNNKNTACKRISMKQGSLSINHSISSSSS